MGLEIIAPLHRYYLHESLNDITKIIDDGNCVNIMTVDFAKTFDSIYHNKL